MRFMCWIGLHLWDFPPGVKSQRREAVHYVCAWCGKRKVVDQTNHEWYP